MKVGLESLEASNIYLALACFYAMFCDLKSVKVAGLPIPPSEGCKIIDKGLPLSIILPPLLRNQDSGSAPVVMLLIAKLTH